MCRDVSALAEAELQRKLSASMADLRKGLSSAQGLHASLRAEAAALESFIPVIVEGAKSGMQQALAKQVRGRTAGHRAQPAPTRQTCFGLQNVEARQHLKDGREELNYHAVIADANVGGQNGSQEDEVHLERHWWTTI